MLCDVATWIGTSEASDQISWLVAATRVAADRVAAMLVAALTLPENSRFPTSSDQSKKWPHFRLFHSPNLLFSNRFALLPTVERRTSSVFSSSLQGDSSCTVNEFQDDIIDDVVCKVRKSAEWSTVSARKTVMT